MILNSKRWQVQAGQRESKRISSYFNNQILRFVPISFISTSKLSECYVTDCRKMYQCDECDQICLTTSFLKKHKRLHSDERPHKCSVCDAAFKDKAYLKRHGVKHTGVKEFKCDLCDKLFSHQRKYNIEEISGRF